MQQAHSQARPLIPGALGFGAPGGALGLCAHPGSPTHPSAVTSGNAHPASMPVGAHVYNMNRIILTQGLPYSLCPHPALDAKESEPIKTSVPSGPRALRGGCSMGGWVGLEEPGESVEAAGRMSRRDFLRWHLRKQLTPVAPLLSSNQRQSLDLRLHPAQRAAAPQVPSLQAWPRALGARGAEAQGQSGRGCGAGKAVFPTNGSTG